MGTVKTTIEITDSLFGEAKACAEARHVPLRQLIEEGLRAVLQQHRRPRPVFKLRDGSFKGKGLQSDFSWPTIRGMIYDGHGE